MEDDEPADTGNPFAISRRDADADADDGNGDFGIRIQKDPGDGKIMTVESLRAAGNAIERDDGRRAPAGNRTVTTADLVNQMLQGGGGGQ